jgi:hypothetical protein
MNHTSNYKIGDTVKFKSIQGMYDAYATLHNIKLESLDSFINIYKRYAETIQVIIDIRKYSNYTVYVFKHIPIIVYSSNYFTKIHLPKW